MWVDFGGSPVGCGNYVIRGRRNRGKEEEIHVILRG